MAGAGSRSRALVGLLGLTMLMSAPPLPGGAAEAAPCAPVVELPGVGPACPRDHGYDLILPDGSTVFTHGPDPLPSTELDVIDLPLPADFLVPPACVDPAALPALPSPANSRNNPLPYRGVLVYARPFDAPDRSATMAPIIRDMMVHANSLWFREGLNSGLPSRLKMLCDGGELVVRHAALPTPKAATNVGTIFGDLNRLGYTSWHEKYWVWYDGFACWCAGIATIDYDDRLHPNNANNHGPDWAITFGVTGFWGWFVMMHEAGHNLGAVQLTSPNTSGGWHCNDGWDVMCYPDGGSQSNYNAFVCPPVWPGNFPRWDCNKNDYFNPVPADQYLLDHWNLASPISRFITYAV